MTAALSLKSLAKDGLYHLLGMLPPANMNGKTAGEQREIMKRENEKRETYQIIETENKTYAYRRWISYFSLVTAFPPSEDIK